MVWQSSPLFIQAPTNPTVSGEARIGATLAAGTPGWAPGTGFTYEWLADGQPIPDAQASTFVVRAEQADRRLSVQVVGRLGDGIAYQRTSAATARVMVIHTPTIVGTPVAGSVLTAKPGSWTTGTTLTYRWYADGVAITGATGSTLKLTSLQRGHVITVRVTGHKSGYFTVGVTSKATPKVPTAATPTIAGRAAVGTKLTARPGTWTTGSTFTYQWYASGVAISGAAGSTFTVGTAQRGKTIVVRVWGHRSLYATVGVTSKATTRVPTVATPTISGRRRVGSRLIANHGTWTSDTLFSYAWYANGAYIVGTAGHVAYTLTSAERGKTITVKVTGAKSGYTTVTKVSAATARII
ncbi:MAG TPA: hypothetical protein VN107_10540 [Microbacterium sp.]|nr:hypothetical protein [Microbacterium sp.]